MLLSWISLSRQSLGISMVLAIGSVASHTGELSKLVDKPLKVAPVLNKEMVCAKLTGREPAQARALIGQALGAKWTEREHEWNLEPDALALAMSQKAVTDMLKVSLDKSIESLDQLNKSGTLDPSSTRTLTVFRLAKLLGVETIGRVPMGTLKVFSPQPTLYQSPMNAEALKLAASVIRDRKPDHRAKTLGIPGPEDAGRFLLGIERFSGGPSMATGMLCTADGRVVEAISTAAIAPADWPSWPVGLDGELAVTLLPETKAGLVRLKKRGPDHDPKLFEPLLLAADAVASVAAIGGQDYVACLPDSTGSLSRFGGAMTIGEAVSQLKSDAISTVVDGALVVTPLDIQSARDTRVDRGLLTQFLEDLARLKRPTLDGVSSYLAKQGRLAGASPVEELALKASGWSPDRWEPLQLFAGGSRIGRSNERFWGSLSARQRERLLSGETVASRELGSSQLSDLRFSLTCTDLQGCMVKTQNRAHPAVSTVALALSPESTWWLTAKKLGLPAGFMPGQSRTMVGWPAQTLGFFKYGQEHGQFDPENGSPQVASAMLVPGSIDRYELILHVNPQVEATMVFMDWVFDPDAKPVGYRDMPADFLKAFDKAYESGMSGRRPPDEHVPP